MESLPFLVTASPAPGRTPGRSLGPGAATARRLRNNRLQPLGDDILHDIARDVGEPEISSVESVRQLRVLDSEQMQDRGVEVIHADAIYGRLVPDLIRLAVVESTLDPASRHPGGEGVGVVIAARF